MSRAKNLANFQTTITDGTTSVATSTAVDAVKNGAAKAWANADGTGTIALRDSLNTSSITDYSTGLVQFNFTNNFANTNYCQSSTTNNWHSYMSHGGKTVSETFTVAGNSSHSATDSAQMNYIAHGDLA
tara:strand:- start:7324 stop:7710 length:387 start_codon:yes stop_codon:yes gene_type:complete